MAKKPPSQQFSSGTLTDHLGQPPLVNAPAAQLLKERFMAPPFSVLDAKQDYWQKRKTAWIGLGIQGELGRGENLLKFSDSVKLDGVAYNTRFASRPKGKIQDVDNDRRPENKNDYNPKKANTFNPNLASGQWPPKPRPPSRVGEIHNPEIKTASWDSKPTGKTGYAECLKTGIGEAFGRRELSATSIFDPVLCEASYRWFCPEGGHILDPFAGGSVRGIVAAYLDYKYTGIDLSTPQIAANLEQGQELVPNNIPNWIVGDSMNVKTLAPGKYDMIFSCPPYFDLEVYSDDPRDLSRMTIKGFMEAYRQIIKDCVSMLADNRFACFVIGEVRDKTGFYQGLVPETIRAFEDAGAGYYNEIILVTAIGSLPVRTTKQFNSGRKIGKTHQNILVFYKGDPKQIKEIFGEVVC